jgi:UDP-N-acetylmuramoyl-tripeptide--D-alanyl-D-alanine ligase
MRASPGRPGSRIKRFIVDAVLEPLIPLRRIESYVLFWARAVVAARKPFIIGVTGSVGKSTTTAMIAAVLAHPDARPIVGRVGCTSDNMNDDVGLAATLLHFTGLSTLPWAYHSRLWVLCVTPLLALRAALGRYPKVMVLEFGVGSTADLHRMVTIARPSVSVVTRIGAAHLEKLKTLQGVVHEKSALVRAVPRSGLVVLGEDHDSVAQLEQAAVAPVVRVPGKGMELSRNITGVVCAHLGIPQHAIQAALADFKPPQRRLHKLDFRCMTVIDDTYNANPMSMKLGLDTLFESAHPRRRRVAILSYMGELGDDAARYHQEVGVYARDRAHVVIGVGELAEHYSPDFWFPTSEACAGQIESLLCFGDCVLVKGSASARMEQVVRKLSEVAAKPDTAALRAGFDLGPVQSLR